MTPPPTQQAKLYTGQTQRNAVFPSNHPKNQAKKYKKRTQLYYPINLQFRHPTPKLLVQNPYLTSFSKFYRMVLLKPPYTPDFNVELRNAGAVHVVKTLTCLKSTLNKGGRGTVGVSFRYFQKMIKKNTFFKSVPTSFVVGCLSLTYKEVCQYSCAVPIICVQGLSNVKWNMCNHRIPGLHNASDVLPNWYSCNVFLLNPVGGI